MLNYATLIAASLLLATVVYPRVGSAQDALGATAQTLGPMLDVSTRVYSMPLGHGELRQFLYATPPHPRAILIMFPGGSGDVGFGSKGRPCHGDNFVVRTRRLWAARDYAVLIPDPKRGLNLRGLRSSNQYAAIVGKLIHFAHRAAAGPPVFLIGTSQGSIAAMNGAAHATQGSVSGIVLTESVAMPGKNSQETVFSADTAGVRVPALIVANKTDRCYVALPAYARGIKNSLIHSTGVEIHSVEGGEGSPNKCSSLSPHGYYGIELEVVGLIDHWLRSRLQ